MGQCSAAAGAAAAGLGAEAGAGAPVLPGRLVLTCKMTDVLTRAQRSRNMAAIRSRDTKPEITVRQLLHRIGYRYVLHDRRLPGRPDLVFPGRRKIILIHGCFWHMHRCRYGRVVPMTNASFWHGKRTGNVARDRATVKALANQGWRVLVTWECQLKNPASLRNRLVAFLNS